jgi:polysaccharide biosynthesis transport protein
MSASPPRPAELREEITLGELAGVARRRAPWIAAGLVLGGLAAGALFAVSTLSHEARATLLFQAESTPADLLSSLELPLGLSALSGASASVAGEIEALRARPLLEGVLRASGPLAPEGRCVRVDDLARQSAWRALRDPPEALAGLEVEVQAWPFPDDEPEGLVLTFLPGGAVEARREGWFGARAPVAAWRPGEPFEALGARVVVRAQGRSGEELAGRSLRVRCPALTRAAEEFLDVLRVAEEPPGSSAVRVLVRDADAERAAALANALVRAYLDENQARRRRMAGRPVEFLEGELARVHEELRAAEDRLQAFGQETGPLALPGAAAEVVEKLTEVDLERARLELELRAAEEVLARVRSGELSEDEIAALEVTGLFTHDLVEPLLGLVARRSELARELTAEHPDVAQADAAIAQRIGAIQGVLESERWKRAETARELDGLVKEYLAELDGFPAIQVELARERRSVEAFTQIYLFLLSRIEQAKIGQASSVPNADVLEWAELPYEPDGPEGWVFLAAGLVLGLGAGLGAAFLREYQERPVVSARGVEARLGVECVPLARKGRPEALRTLRALLPRGEGALRPLVIVPVGRRARGAELAAELARTCARAGERVLLADADLAEGRLHERFQRAQGPGLAECLASGEGGGKAQQASGEEGLTLVARGAGGGPVPAAALARCLADFGRAHERVLLSAPPTARSGGVYELAGPGVDCVLLVAGAGEEELARVARRLEQCGARATVAVLQVG